MNAMHEETAQGLSIGHLESLRSDVRDEIKQRIKQRDQYSVQLTVIVGTLLGIATAASRAETSSAIAHAYRVLLAAPLVSIYFTALILYSYRVHKILAKYLREQIEPELSRRCDTPLGVELETYYAKNAVPGIRRAFFLSALWVSTIGAPLYVGFMEDFHGTFMLPLFIMFLVSLVASILLTMFFWN